VLLIPSSKSVAHFSWSACAAVSSFFIKALHSVEDVNDSMPFCKLCLHVPVAWQKSTEPSDVLLAEAQVPLPSAASTKSAMPDTAQKHVTSAISGMSETTARIGAHALAFFMHVNQEHSVLVSSKSVGCEHSLAHAFCASRVNGTDPVELGRSHLLFTTTHPVDMGQQAAE
jgi:hypothetical protein